MNKVVEIEIRVRIKSSTNLLNFLSKKAKFLYETRQKDTYFVPKHRDFTKTNPIREWLRLRNSDGKYYITYKNWYVDKAGRSDYCDEFETSLGQIEPMIMLFKALNFREIVKVSKKRRVWKFKKYLISIDKIKGLGEFVEIEFEGKTNKTAREITNKMIEFLKSMKCGKIEKNYQGYPFMLLFPKKVKWEVVK